MGLVLIQVYESLSKDPIDVKAVLSTDNQGEVFALFAVDPSDPDYKTLPFRVALPQVIVEIDKRDGHPPIPKICWIWDYALTRSEVVAIPAMANRDGKFIYAADVLELLHHNPETKRTNPLTREELVRLAAEARAAMPKQIIESMAISMDLPEAEVEELFDRIEIEWEQIKSKL